jgi:hypothetical protein
MLILYDFIAPMHHCVCDLLGVERNKYGIISNQALPILSNLMFHIKCAKIPDIELTHEAKNLKTFLQKTGMYSRFEESVLQEEFNAISPEDYSICNYVLYKYFDAKRTSLDPSWHESLSVPFHLLNEDPNNIYKYVFQTEYFQDKPIPRWILKRYHITEDYICTRAEHLGMKLLPEPFTDNIY